MDDLDHWYQHHFRSRSPVPDTENGNLTVGKPLRSSSPVPPSKLKWSSSAGILEIHSKSTDRLDRLSPVRYLRSISNSNTCSSERTLNELRLSPDNFDDTVASNSSVSLLYPQRRNLLIMKKGEGSKIPALKGLKKISRSPLLGKKQQSPDNLSTGTKSRSGSSNLLHPNDESHLSSYSNEDLHSETCDGASSVKDNGSVELLIDDIDGSLSDGAKTKAVKDQLKDKIHKTVQQIEKEQASQEENVKEYLKLATSIDKQQAARIKTVFEKKNQKSTQHIAHLQKKLEKYQEKLKEVETHGVSSHKQAKEVLRDMGQGLKVAGANLVDGITGFSGGVVGNIRGAKDTIVSKPKEFAHLIKNKFGSADNITLRSLEETRENNGEKKGGGGTLPASFKYGSDEENSSITSGSGYGAHSSPHSQSQNASQLLIPQSALEPILVEVNELKENSVHMKEMLSKLLEEFESFKIGTQTEILLLRTTLDEENNKSERMETQMNDLTELHQNEIINLKQDIAGMEEKIEYQLDERTTDTNDLLESCQTRVTKLELQLQQQQLISMEMVDDVRFRTILTKLINVVLAVLAVILVLVSTTANLLSPFLTSRSRIVCTVVLIVMILLMWRNWSDIETLGYHIRTEYLGIVFGR